MPTYIALLRAVNVGGAGKLPMTDLKKMCVGAGFENVVTYIASGNVVFDSPGSEADVKTALESCLKRYAGKPVGVMVRTGAEMAAVLKNNPFPNAPPNRTVAVFLDRAPAADALSTVSNRKDEELAAGRREIYISYGDGMASSKLKVPAAAAGTARNMNTVARLAELARRR